MWKQSTRMTSNHARMLDLCVLPGIPWYQFKVHSSKIFTTYVPPASLRYAKDVGDSLSVFAHYAFGTLQPPFRRFCFLIQAATAHRVLYSAPVPFPACPCCHRCITHPCSHCEHLQIMLVVWRIVTRENLRHCRSLQPSIFVTLVMSWWSGESPVLILVTKSSHFSRIQPLLTTSSAT